MQCPWPPTHPSCTLGTHGWPTVSPPDLWRGTEREGVWEGRGGNRSVGFTFAPMNADCLNTFQQEVLVNVIHLGFLLRKNEDLHM